jgi:hypothetical protein
VEKSTERIDKRDVLFSRSRRLSGLSDDVSEDLATVSRVTDVFRLDGEVSRENIELSELSVASDVLFSVSRKFAGGTSKDEDDDLVLSVVYTALRSLVVVEIVDDRLDSFG